MANGVGSTATELSPPIDGSPSSSQQLLSSSISSLSSSKHGASKISKAYKHASSLFLTRRLKEALSTIEPIVSSPSSNEQADELEETAELPPVANASRNTRFKVWNLYLTILNSIVELDPEEGKAAFGNREWKALVAKVRDGKIWEEVIQSGYSGVEGDVDAEVIISLATLLLSHARDQTLTQQRLETYLSAASQPSLDISSHLDSSTETITSNRRRPSPHSNGTNTPRDLNSRIKILELYTLHVLPLNNEWEYAREFINMSEVLDEERREAFLQALQGLLDEKDQLKEREADLQRKQQEQQQDAKKSTRSTIDQGKGSIATTEERTHKLQEGNSHKKTSSEVDYGIASNPHSSRDTPAPSSPKPSSSSGPKRSSPLSPSSQSPRSSKKAPSSAATSPSSSSKRLYKRAAILLSNLKRVITTLAQSMSSNPTTLLRTVLFLMGFVLALSRRDVRERLRRITGAGWEKVRRTAGMGVKVSYL
ncbi:MAG: hypothetical protein M1819_000857 [Sarea resinae]|nr:MAG: hypothetical protein M1819_000857 [Sarea resinae]